MIRRFGCRAFAAASTGLLGRNSFPQTRFQSAKQVPRAVPKATAAAPTPPPPPQPQPQCPPQAPVYQMRPVQQTPTVPVSSAPPMWSSDAAPAAVPPAALNKHQNELLQLVNGMQDALTRLQMKVELDLPQITVVGAQSSGKSSVLELIVGRDFLPRGSGIVTRCPLVLQLIQLPAGVTEEWGEFVHRPKQKYVNFVGIREEIEAHTRQIAPHNNIVATPINLKIYSSRVLNLTLVDLPGLVSTPVGNQPLDIEKQIRELVLSYISNPNTIILAVSPANADLATSAALKIAKEVDPGTHRTLGVLTKLDLMDAGTDAMEMMEGRLVKLQLGFVGVVNRSQKDIIENRSMEDAREAEKSFFLTHPSYTKIANRMGSSHLTKILNALLLHHIQRQLPSLKTRVDDLLKDVRVEQQRLELVDGYITDPRSLLLQLLQKFCDAVKNELEGRALDASQTELTGGARINYIFHEMYAPHILNLQCSMDLADEQVLRTTIRNCSGLQSTLFPTEVFTTLVRKQIRKLEDPSMECIASIHQELCEIVGTSAQLLDRFPILRDRVVDITLRMLDVYRHPCVNFVHTLISAEECYIDVTHPSMQESLAKAAVSLSVPPATAGPKPVLQAPAPVAAPPPPPSAQPPMRGRTAAAVPRSATPLSVAAAPQPVAFEDAPPEVSGVFTLASIPKHITLLDKALSPREQQQHTIVRNLVGNYFSICQRNIADQIPKIISLMMVAKLIMELQRTLTSELHTQDDTALKTLVRESSDVAMQREAVSKKLQFLQDAQAALAVIRNYPVK